MKRTCSLITLLCLLMMSIPLQSAALAAPAIGLFLDGERLATDVPPVLVNNRTLVPLRVISESLGAEVTWTSNQAPIIIRKGLDQISLQMGDKTAMRNGQPLVLDVPAQLIGSRTMVPLRFIGESLGAGVQWVSSPPSVYITSPVGELGMAEVQQADGVATALTFTSSRPIVLGQTSVSDQGNEFAVSIGNIAAQAEDVSGLELGALLGYKVVPGADHTALVSISIGDDAPFRSPRAELSADGMQLTISWPLTIKQTQFTQTGGVEQLFFAVSPSVQPQLTATDIEITSAGTLVGRVNAEVGVNLRSDPSTALDRIALVPYNELVTIIGETTGWYQVRLADGREGWMADPYIAVYTNTEEKVGVNVRKTASLQAPVLATLPLGHPITVLKRLDGWCLVDYGNGKTGYIADWLVPISSRLTESSTVPAVKISFPGVARDCQLLGELADSAHIDAFTWEESSQGVAVVMQLKHPVSYRLKESAGGWSFTLGTWLENLVLTETSVGSSLQIALDGHNQPKVSYASASQAVVVTLANSTLAGDAATALPGDNTLVSGVQAEQVGSDVRITIPLLRKVAYNLHKTDDLHWEVSLFSPTVVGKTIALDPGHGATDPGATGTLGWNEKDYTHDIVNRLRAMLVDAGAKVVTTREVHSAPIVHHERAALINRSGADLFLSVHINSFTNRNVRGLETFYYPRGDNERFARLIQGELVASLGWLDRGVKSNKAYILTREALTTGALAEVGFISNPDDERLLYQAAIRQQIAEALYRAIDRYFAD